MILAIAAIIATNATKNSVTVLSFFIKNTSMIKPKPAWAINPEVFISRPGWRYLSVLAGTKESSGKQM